MAQNRQDLLSKLADRGEDVVGKISEMPAAQRLLDAGMQLKDRVDELSRASRTPAKRAPAKRKAPPKKTAS